MKSGVESVQGTIHGYGHFRFVQTIDERGQTRGREERCTCRDESAYVLDDLAVFRRVVGHSNLIENLFCVSEEFVVIAVGKRLK